MASNDSAISDSALFILVVGASMTIWLMPYIAQIQYTILDTYASLVNWMDALLAAILAFPGWVEVAVPAAIATAISILISLAILAFEIILALWVLGAIFVYAANYCDKAYRAKLKREGKEHPQDRAERLAREEEAREEERRRIRVEAAQAAERDRNRREKREARRREAAERAEQREMERREQAEREWAEMKRKREEKMQHEYHLDSDLWPQEQEKLATSGYEKVKISPYGDTGASWYWVKKSDRESPAHSFFVYLIRDLVKKHIKDDINLDRWHGADVVFDWNGLAYAIDIETGSILERNPEYLTQRYAKYRKYYNAVYILVTNKALKKNYAKYGTVITRATMKKAVERIFEE